MRKRDRVNRLGEGTVQENKTGSGAENDLRVLACDTSSAACSCCYQQDGTTVAMSFLSVGLKHSQTFMPMVHDLIKKASARYEDLDLIACTVGPGSFTGIRIGVGAVQAMAFAAEKPAVPVSSLKALAFPLFDRENTLVVSMIDARNARVFAAAYFNGVEVVPEGARPVEEMIRMCDLWRDGNAPQASIVTCGNACRMYADDSKRVDVTPMFAFQEIDPRAVAAIAADVFLRVDPEERKRQFIPEALLPVYLTRTAAERNLKTCAPKD
ncbi:MAG: tRNA (adenosine(37)-N6)-threonylcarbamoyltransferase complex dimerization subunit type 1 TsaB [Clostridiales bacterium]|nr:tRNA (adenosine(37)-N6)-threonylcarbamoyltransferase complex dimerization subunit type 1 TsaB [Clostridiales bacterium]